MRRRDPASSARGRQGVPARDGSGAEKATFPGVPVPRMDVAPRGWSTPSALFQGPMMIPHDTDREQVAPPSLDWTRRLGGRAGTWFGGVELVLGGAAGGYALSAPPTGPFERTSEAIGDLAVPVVDAVGRRAAAEGLRAETERFLEAQEAFLRQEGRVRQPEEVPRQERGFRILYHAPAPGSWLAQVRYADAFPGGVSCAVVVGRVPSYVGGIALRRSGQVRCSHDLATRLNGLWSRFTPVRQGG